MWYLCTDYLHEPEEKASPRPAATVHRTAPAPRLAAAATPHCPSFAASHDPEHQSTSSVPCRLARALRLRSAAPNLRSRSSHCHCCHCCHCCPCCHLYHGTSKTLLGRPRVHATPSPWMLAGRSIIISSPPPQAPWLSANGYHSSWAL